MFCFSCDCASSLSVLLGPGSKSGGLLLSGVSGPVPPTTLVLIDNGHVVKLLKPRTISSIGNPRYTVSFVLTLLMMVLVLVNAMVFALFLARTVSSYFPTIFPDPRLSVPFSILVDQPIHHWQAELLGCTMTPLKTLSAMTSTSSLR